MPSRERTRLLKNRLANRKYREMYPEKARERGRLYYERQREKLAREREEARRRRQQNNDDENSSVAEGNFLEYWTRKELKRLCLKINSIRRRLKKIKKPVAGESSVSLRRPAGLSARRFVDRQVRGRSPQVTICSSRGVKFYRDNSSQTIVSYKNKVRIEEASLTRKPCANPTSKSYRHNSCQTIVSYRNKASYIVPKWRSSARCVVPGCKVRTGNGVALFRFPCPLGDSERRAEWLRVIGLREADLNSNSRVCRWHFHDKHVLRLNGGSISWDALPVVAMMTTITAARDMMDRDEEKEERIFLGDGSAAISYDDRVIDVTGVVAVSVKEEVEDNDDEDIVGDRFTLCDDHQVLCQIHPADFLAEKPINSESEQDSLSTAAASGAISDSAYLGAVAMFHQLPKLQKAETVVETSQSIGDEEEYRDETSSGIQVVVKRESEIEEVE